MKAAKFLFAFAVVFIILPQLHAQTVNVKVETIQPENIARSVSYVGNITGLREVSIPSKKDSVLEKITVKEGKKYKNNAVLAVLETEQSQIALKQAELSLRSALNDLLLQEDNLQLAVNGYLYDLYALGLSKKELEREQTLFDRGMSSDAVLDSIRKKLMADQLKADQSGIMLAGINVNTYKPTYRSQINRQLKKNIKLPDIQLRDTVDYNPVKRALINFESARTNYKKALLNLSDSFIKAPFGGTLLKINDLEIGQYIRKGESLMSFGDITKVIVELDVNQTDLSQIPVGTPSVITVDAVPGKTFKGVVSSVAQQGSDQNRAFPVKITVDNKQNFLKPGYSARVKINLLQLKNQIVIPTYAIIYGSDDTYVYTVDRDTAKKTVIKTGENIGQDTHVISGLKTGDRIIVKGQGFLKENDKVFIIAD